MNLINDLSDLTLLKFKAENSDHDNCIDVSTEGYITVGGQDIVLPPGILEGDGVSSPRRNFLARIDKRQIPNLIAVLQDAIKIKGMTNYKYRAMTEKKELNEKLTSLADFIYHGPYFNDLRKKEQSLLKKQEKIMRRYSGILEERISNFR